MLDWVSGVQISKSVKDPRSSLVWRVIVQSLGEAQDIVASTAVLVYCTA